MPNSISQSKRKPRRFRRSTAAAITSAVFISGGAIASTQPWTDNPFATSGSLSDTILGTGGSSLPSFPDIPGSTPPIVPESGGVPSGGEDRELLGTVSDVLNGGSIEDTAIDILGKNTPGGFPEGIPSIFRDILSGNIGGILGSIFDIFKTENEIFEEIAEVVLSDGWEGIGDGNKTPPDPYKVRLPEASDEAQRNHSEGEARSSFITQKQVVYRRDRANQYDQEMSRAMAAPMLGNVGQDWINKEIAVSSKLLEEGANSALSAVTKAGEATKATSTQDIVRASAEMSGMAVNMQLQEMQQNNKMQQSLWQMQRLNSAQLQLAANASEAADEANRRERASRSSALSAAAYSTMIIPGLEDGNSIANTAPDNSIPDAPNLFAN